jgi:hypothetical protein
VRRSRIEQAEHVGDLRAVAEALHPHVEEWWLRLRHGIAIRITRRLSPGSRIRLFVGIVTGARRQ